MRIAFNPSTVAALTSPPNNKDITFDLRGQNIFARGVKFYGTDTWRPVVDNLTSNSATSSLSANQGRVLAGLINGKSDSDHNHDGRYVKKSGDTMLGALNFANCTWNLVGNDSYMGDCDISGHFGIKAANTTYPGIAFFNNASAFLGNLTAYSGNIKYGAYSLQFLDNGNTSVSASTWTNPFSAYNSNAVADGQAICVWGQASQLSNLSTDTGDMSLWLKRVNAKVATLNMVLDGEYYANGNQRLAHISEIPTSLKSPHSLTLKANGTTLAIYDGSSAKEANFTYANVGAAPSAHNHDGRYLRLSGDDTMNGPLRLKNNTWNFVGDDVKIGDHNVSGGLGILGANGSTRIDFCQYGKESNFKSITFDGTTLYLDGTSYNSDHLSGLSVNNTNFQKPFGKIPVIASDGVTELGRYIDFHYDNSGSYDFSTRLQASGNNKNIVTLPSASGTLALTSDILNYYWANVKISTSSSTTTSPTVSNLTATNSIKMGNILLEYADEINNITNNGSLNLNYRNSGNVSLCAGGGKVGIGTGYPLHELHVMGYTHTKGFGINPYYLSDSGFLSTISPGDGYTYRCLEIGSSTKISCIIADKTNLSGSTRGVILNFNKGFDGQLVLLKDLQNYGSGNGYFWVMPSGCKIIRADGSSILIGQNQLSNTYDDGRSRFFIYSSKYSAWIEFLCANIN